MQTTQLTQLLHQRQLSFFRKFQNERPEYYISAGTELRGVLDNFWFHGNVCAVAQRAFVDFCCGFDLPLDHSEREAAFFTIDERGTLSVFHIAPSVCRLVFSISEWRAAYVESRKFRLEQRGG